MTNSPPWQSSWWISELERELVKLLFQIKMELLSMKAPRNISKLLQWTKPAKIIKTEKSEAIDGLPSPLKIVDYQLK